MPDRRSPSGTAGDVAPAPRHWSSGEPEMTRACWRALGGTLIPEYRVVDQGPTCHWRAVDAVILSDGPFEERRPGDVPTLDGRDVLVIQTKCYPASLGLLGQAILSPLLIRARWRPRSLGSVAVHTGSDPLLSDILTEFAVEEFVTASPTAPRMVWLSRLDRSVVRRVHAERGGTLVLGGTIASPSTNRRLLRTQGILLEGTASQVVDISGDPDRLVAMVAGRSVTLIATTKRLGMYVAGEAIIGARLLLRLGAASAKAVVVAGFVDSAIRAALTSLGGIEVLPDA